MLSSGSGTCFGDRRIQVWISSSTCCAWDLGQVTCVSELWFSHVENMGPNVEAGLTMMVAVGITWGGVYARVYTGPHVHAISRGGMFFPLAHSPARYSRSWGAGAEPGPVSPSAYFPPASMTRSWRVPLLGPGSQYLIPPHAPYLWKGATASSQEVLINAATGSSCQGLGPVSSPSPLHWL